MTRTTLLVAWLSLLGTCDRAWADPGPMLAPASGAAPSETLVETIEPGTIQPGPTQRVESVPAPSAPPATGDSWRYRWYQGRWWYYLPNQQWVYWDKSSWQDVALAAPPAFDPRLDPAMIPVWRGPAPRFGAPPISGMPRYNGLPSPSGYINYHGRIVPANGGYANGFLQFSSPYGGFYGPGRQSFPYYGW